MTYHRRTGVKPRQADELWRRLFLTGEDPGWVSRAAYFPSIGVLLRFLRRTPRLSRSSAIACPHKIERTLRLTVAGGEAVQSVHQRRWSSNLSFPLFSDQRFVPSSVRVSFLGLSVTQCRHTHTHTCFFSSIQLQVWKTRSHVTRSALATSHNSQSLLSSATLSMNMATNFTPFMSRCLTTEEWGVLSQACSWNQIIFHSLFLENTTDLLSTLITITR